MSKKNESNVAKEIARMNVGRVTPLRPTLKCMDILRSDLKEHQVDPKLAQKMEEWREAFKAIDTGREKHPYRDNIGKDEHVCVLQL